jgi:magnesium transporter
MMGIGMEITLIVSLTLVCITLWSAVVSSVIPMVLKRIGIDPAVVSGPVYRHAYRRYRVNYLL